jgi:hypothetical protein
MPQFNDSLFLGSAPTGLEFGNGNPGGTGVGPMGRIYVWDVVPLTLQAAGLAALQTLAGAGNFTLTAGTGVTTTTLASGTTAYVLDCPRCVTAASTGNISAATFTISGYDVYGQPMSAAITGPNNSTVATTKAFKMITTVASSAAVGTNTSIGFNDKLGLPFRVTNVAYVASVRWNSTLAADTGTFVAADTTDPATTATTDVRGCYTPSSAADGTKRLVMGFYLPAIASGPSATRAGALGVVQV